jgi:hypothetical protein
MLLLLGLLRASLLVVHEPVVGYAGGPDMQRIAACQGLYPGATAQSRASPDAPVAFYHRDAANREGCYASSEVVLDAAVLATARTFRADAQGIRLQWVGFAKLGLLFVTAFLFAWALHEHPGASIAHGAIVLLVLSDPVVTLWFNTLYPEFFVIWGLYAAIGAACSLAIAERGAVVMWGLLAVASVALAFASGQFALLGPALVAASWPWLWYRSAALTVTVFVIATVACVVSFTLVQRPESAQLVNRATTHEPEALARSVAKALPAVQPISIGSAGTLEGPAKVSLRDLPWWAFSPLDAIASRLPFIVLAPLALAALLLGPLALLLAIAWARPASANVGTPFLFAMLLGGTVLYAFVTTVFGLRLNEATRHFLPGALAMYTALVAVLVGAPFVFGRWRGTLKQGAMEIIVGGAIVAIIVLAGVMALAWGERQGLAMGALDEPAGKQAPSTGLKVSGWALDPYGVEIVQVQLGKLERTARYGEARPDIEATYPRYPDAHGAGFALDLTADELAKAGAPGELPLRIIVKSRSGAVTEIGERQITVAP